MNELNKTIERTEAILQDARGELSVFENKFPTDSAEAQLIAELIEQLDEASDPHRLRETITEYAGDYDVDCEEVHPSDVRCGDVIYYGAHVAEVVGLDAWHTDERGNEYELTVEPYGKERDTFVVSEKQAILRTLEI